MEMVRTLTSEVRSLRAQVESSATKLDAEI
jgi:hypothetical protein